MRTTVTLDPDVERLLRETMRRSRKGFKQVLNEALRRGLEPAGQRVEPPFVVAARSLGLRSGIDPVRVRDLDDELEVEEFLRKTRALGERSS
jgi:hypothetical protein